VLETVALLSGGLDSTVALAWALDTGLDVKQCIHFQYGQTHSKEVRSAEAVAEHYKIPLRPFFLPFNHISATDVGHLLLRDLDPVAANNTVLDSRGNSVSATFVPGRNIIFLAYAGSLCDSLGYTQIVIGVNSVDYSGYPDCRPQFIEMMEHALSSGLRWPVRIQTPLIHKSKVSIIKMGINLGAPLHLTWSCYTGLDKPCGKCPSCVIRIQGFKEVGVEDPATR
jgi:7-cyano-7-deazaguanine synthase